VRAGRSLALLLLLGVAAPARAMVSGAVRDSLTRAIDGLEAFGWTGQIVIAEGDSVIVSRAVGLSDGRARPVTPATGFAAGSITKSLCAAVILRLVGEGRFTLDTPLSRLLPSVPPDKAAITPRQLLSHMAGMPEDAEGVFEMDSRDAVIRKTLSVALPGAPGERFAYSNAGFQLLAAIAEQASGVPMPRLVDSLLLSPSGMHESGVGSAYARARTDVATCRNEWIVSGSPSDWRQPWAGSGAGDLVTTAFDLYRWARVFQGDGSLTRSQIDTMTARHAEAGNGLHYGFGLWLIPRDDGGDLVSIGGDVTGCHAGVWLERDPPRRIVAMTFAGERWGRRLPLSVAQRSLWLMLKSQAAALPPDPVRWPAERLDALAGRWTLAPAGRLNLVRDGVGLRLELAGSDAMTLAEGPDTSGARAFAEGRAADLVRAASAHDDSAWARVLLPVERGWSRAIRTTLQVHEKRNGRLIDAAIDGTVALPWLDHGLRTYVRLHSKGGDTDVSFAFLSGGLIDVATAEGRPAPVILPVAPLTEGGLGAYDILNDTLIRVQPFRDANGEGLRLTANGTIFVARRHK